ncbi:hypothetical protein EON82_26745 [bacterium]|nr:MAG: hypothetical protein EON82_26745 [bacterium]
MSLLCVSCSSPLVGESSEVDGVVTAYCDDCCRFTEFQGEDEMDLRNCEDMGRRLGFPAVLIVVRTLLEGAAVRLDQTDTYRMYAETRTLTVAQGKRYLARAEAYLRGAEQAVKAL